MVFSFFKKPPPEKMVAKPAAAPPRPQPAAPAPAAPAAASGVPAAVAPDQAAKPALKPLDFTTPSGFSDLSESPGDIHLENDIDPVEADIEQAAVLYANAQNDATRALLEHAVHVHSYGPGERLWLMLFDFYRLAGQHVPFDALALEYAKNFEKSPPPWRDSTAAKSAPARATAPGGTVLFKGQLTRDNDAGFTALEQALEKVARLRLELKVKEVDDGGAERLLAALTKARRKGGEIELIGRDGLAAVLAQAIAAGRADNRNCWLLLLELHQLMGHQETFDDLAIDYAVTFEVSPPSWEPKRVAAPEPPSSGTPAAEAGGGESLAFAVKGDIKLERFAGLPAFVDKSETVVLDLAEVTRIDFVSAGTLVNLLTPAKRAGKRVVIRHPNHLVAELLGVVGLRAVAEIAYAKA